jgi:DNA invertase Pin-like site-specific DNA recombinase
MRIGYARVSTQDQCLDLQIDALERAGCERIFKDPGVSGVAVERPGLIEALGCVQEGDALVVWRLDRIARSMRDLTDTVMGLHHRGVEFMSLCEYINVTSAFGEFTLHVLAAAAHLERALIVERTRAGMQAAKERGATFGRKPALDGEMLREALILQRQGLSVQSIATQLGVGRSTMYRYMAES